MINDRPFHADQFIRAAGDLPEIDPQLRKRVLRAAREAQERRTIRKRVQWALGGSAAAIVLAGIFSAVTGPNPSPSRYAPSAMNGPSPSALRSTEDSPAEKAVHSRPEKRAAQIEQAR